MIRIGVWDRQGRFFDGVAASLAALGDVELLRGSHPADFTNGPLDLLCVSPTALGWAGLGAVDCRVLLLPGTAGVLARNLPCACAVSYGTSPKDTLTFSSLEGDHICVALQRELTTLRGVVLEEQEFVLPFPAGSDPMTALAATGILLLAGEGGA